MERHPVWSETEEMSQLPGTPSGLLAESEELLFLSPCERTATYVVGPGREVVVPLLSPAVPPEAYGARRDAQGTCRFPHFATLLPQYPEYFPWLYSHDAMVPEVCNM